MEVGADEEAVVYRHIVAALDGVRRGGDGSRQHREYRFVMRPQVQSAVHSSPALVHWIHAEAKWRADADATERKSHHRQISLQIVSWRLQDIGCIDGVARLSKVFHPCRMLPLVLSEVSHLRWTPPIALSNRIEGRSAARLRKAVSYHHPTCHNEDKHPCLTLQRYEKSVDYQNIIAFI